MKPRADHACLSKKCLTDDGEAMVYELPSDATHCPMGHKRLRRLFNAVGVIGLRRGLQPEADWRLTSNSFAARADVLLEDTREGHERRSDAAERTPSFKVGDREQEVSHPSGQPFTVPSGEAVKAMFGRPGKSEPMTQMEVHRDMRRDPLGVPSMLRGINQQGVPTVVVGRER